MAYNVPIIRYCQVLSVDDPTGADRVKVILHPEDNDKIDEYGRADIEKLDFCIPLLPSIFHVKPKEGEGCLVITAIANDGNSQRYYIGPLISQPHRMEYDPFFLGADSQFRGSLKKQDPNPKLGRNKEGVFPDDDDITIEGRRLTQVQLKDDELRLKVGVKKPNENDDRDITFNTKNPSYIKMKYNEGIEPTDAEKAPQSSISIVGDTINLLGHNSRLIPNGLTDSKDLITDEKLKEIYEKAQKLPYGNELVDFLQTFVDAFKNHTHNYNNLPPNSMALGALTTKSDRLLKKGELLSDTVRIN